MITDTSGSILRISSNARIPSISGMRMSSTTAAYERARNFASASFARSDVSTANSAASVNAIDSRGPYSSSTTNTGGFSTSVTTGAAGS